MERRDFVTAGALGLGSLAAGVFSKKAMAEEAKKTPKSKHEILVAAASECVRTGELCVAHCNAQMAKGEKNFAKCAQRATEAIAACRALMTLAASHSEFTKAFAKATASVCEACKQACNEHSAHFAHGMHMECKNCMEACEACAKSCKDMA